MSAGVDAEAASTGPGDVVWRERAIPRDVQDVRDLVELVGVFSEPEIAIAAELVMETLQRGAAAGYEFVFAERADRLAGYACFGPIPATADSYDLYWIAVHPDERGRGLGAALMARSEQRIAAAGGRRIFIDTSSRSGYASAHRLYATSGFREAARLDGFYGPNDAKLIFAKTLAAAKFAAATDRDG